MSIAPPMLRGLMLVLLIAVALYAAMLHPRLLRRSKPVLRSMLELEGKLLESKVLPRVCVLAPVTSRNQNWQTVGDTCLARILLPSLERTCEQGVYEYVMYVGYDTSDAFFSSPDMLQALGTYANASFKRFSVRFLSFDNPTQKPGPVMNGLSKAAYDDGCEYLYRVNDDSELVTPWTSKFVSTLQGFKPALVGVVGPTCREGNTQILIQDFVHRKHHEIFGRHYPPVLTDWWLDDWISLVYGEARTVKHPDVLAVHRMDATRYVVTKENEHRLKFEVEADKKVLERFLRGHESAATSGKLFQMRRQQRELKVDLDVGSKGPLPETTYPTGGKWAVITTIFKPTALIRMLASADGWCTVVVGDAKSLPEPDYMAELGAVNFPCFVYLTVEKQRALDYAIEPLIGVNTFGRKNVGFIFAMQHGAERIYDTDDDNEIHDMEFLNQWTKTQPADLKWVVTGSNPYPAFGVSNVWPRGLPLDHIKDEGSYAVVEVETDYHPPQQTCIVQSLANEEPDVDAIYRLTSPNYPLSFDATRRAAYIRQGSMAPFNAQATLFMADGFGLMLLPTTVHGRVSDIWRGYLAQAVGRCRLVFSSPWATQKRNAHNYMADFESETPLYSQASALVEYLVRQVYSGPGAAMQDMYEHGIVGAGDVRLAHAWELDVKRAMAKPRVVAPKFRHLFISMGKVHQLHSWMQRIMADPRVDHVDMVLGSFDQRTECSNERVECHFVGGTSWTTGRNALVKLAYQREKRLGFEYDYWTTTDADTVIRCRVGPGLTELPGGCFAEYDQFLQQVGGPIVALHREDMMNPNQDVNNAMGAQEGFDAAWNSFHRDAIPVLMPYYADLDAVTWWSSQAIFWYRVQCFGPMFATAPLSMFYRNPDHNPYPQNPRNFEAERAVGTAHLYELIDQIPKPPLDYPEQIRQERVRSIESIKTAGDWRVNANHFRKCEAAFKDRFTQFVEGV